LLIPRRQKKLKHHWLLEGEIQGFQDALAAFILDEVCSKKGLFSLWRAEIKENKEYTKLAANRLL
jgi:hypothetical protein